MTRTLLFVCLIALIVGAGCKNRGDWSAEDWPANAQSTKEVDHSGWQGLLDKYLVVAEDDLNRLDYARFLSDDRASLQEYIEAMATLDPGELSRPEQMAYWINLYNALTVREILDAYPLKSILDINNGKGPWKKPVVTVVKRSLSLDDIEHRLLRGLWQEPRIHFAVNCASVGCPDIQAKVFTGKDIDRQLQAAALNYLRSMRGVAEIDNTLVLSSLFEWYAEDFGNNERSVRSKLSSYADPQTAAMIEQWQGEVGYQYDWSLNDTREQD